MRSIFFRLDYPIGLINSTINMFIQNIVTKPEKKTDDGNTIRIVFPFKDQIAVNAVHRQLRDLSNKIAVNQNIHNVSFSLDNDVRERRNVVYFLAVYF